MKRILAFFLALVALLCLGACGSSALKDGTYAMDVSLSGGSGRASVTASEVTLSGEDMTATITWSSGNYDYMIVDGETILPSSTEGGSTFTFPIAGLDREIPVQADTVAMSTPHLIDYTLTFDSSTAQEIQK